MWRKVGIARQGAQHGVEMSLGPHPSFQLALRRVLPMAVAPDHTLVGGVMVLRMGAPVLCHARIPHSEELRTDPQDPQWQHCRLPVTYLHIQLSDMNVLHECPHTAIRYECMWTYVLLSSVLLASVL
jgi:hypothetical protein